MKEQLYGFFGLTPKEMISWDQIEDLEFMVWYDLKSRSTEVLHNRFMKISTSIRKQVILFIELEPDFELEKHHHDFKKVYTVIAGSVIFNNLQEISEGESHVVFHHVQHSLKAGEKGCVLLVEILKTN